MNIDQIINRRAYCKRDEDYHVERFKHYTELVSWYEMVDPNPDFADRFTRYAMMHAERIAFMYRHRLALFLCGSFKCRQLRRRVLRRGCERPLVKRERGN